jgi:hypothetical protein
MPKLKNPSPVGHEIETERRPYCQCNIAKKNQAPKTCGLPMKPVNEWTWECKTHGEMH